MIPPYATFAQLDAFFADIIARLESCAVLKPGTFVRATFKLENLRFSEEPQQHPYIGSPEYMQEWKNAILADHGHCGEGQRLEHQPRPGPHEQAFQRHIRLKYTPISPHSGYEMRASWQALSARCAQLGLECKVFKHCSAFGRLKVDIFPLVKLTLPKVEEGPHVSLHVEDHMLPLPLAA